MFDFPWVIKINYMLTFIELGGFIFPKVKFFDSTRIAELVEWSKMFENVPFFLEVSQDAEVFRRSQKIGRVNNE